MGIKNKNYFRHFFQARKDEKIIKIKERFGFKGAYNWWVLVELCAEYTALKSENFKEIECIFHERTLREELSLVTSSLHEYLTFLQASCNLHVTFIESTCRILIPNLWKYLGSKSEHRPLLEYSRVEKNRVEKSKKEINKENQISVSEVFHQLGELWNSHCGILPKCKSTSGKRFSKCENLWSKYPDRNYWIEIIFKISNSDFCNGKSKEGWRATFDWLLQPDVHLKVSEGKYENVIKISQSDHIRDQFERLKRGEL